MTNKVNIIIIGILLLVAIAGIVLNLANPTTTLGNSLFTLGLSAANFASLSLLLRNSDIFNTVYFKFISGFIAIALVGAVFKLLHLPGAIPILVTALFLILATYILRFIKKTNKNKLDVLKVLWVIVTYGMAGAIIFGYQLSYFEYFPDLLLIVLVIVFLLSDNAERKRTAPDSTRDVADF